MSSRFIADGTNDIGQNVGIVLGFLAAAYALLYNLNLWFTGDSGLFRAHQFFLLALLLISLTLGDLGRVALQQFYYNPISGRLIVFLLWVLVAGFRATLTDNVSYLPLLHDIIYGIALGFVVGCGYRVKLFSAARFRTLLSLKYLVIVLTLALWLVPYYYLTRYSYTFRNDIFGLGDIYISNYQQIADYFGIAFIVVLGVQSAWFIRYSRGVTGFTAFFFLQFVQLVSAAYVLQAFFSNKGPLLAALVSLSATLAVLKMHIESPAKRLILITVLIITSFAAFEMLTYISESYLSMDVIKNTRLTSYGKAEDVADLSSFNSRWSTLILYLDVFFENFLFGNPAVGLARGDYLHSLLSIQTNLGIVGSILFLLLVARGYILNRKQNSAFSPQILIVRISFFPILFVCAISEFFSWIVLWFLFGGLLAMNTRRSGIFKQHEM